MLTSSGAIAIDSSGIDSDELKSTSYARGLNGSTIGDLWYTRHLSDVVHLVELVLLQ